MPSGLPAGAGGPAHPLAVGELLQVSHDLGEARGLLAGVTGLTALGGTRRRPLAPRDLACHLLERLGDGAALSHRPTASPVLAPCRTHGPRGLVKRPRGEERVQRPRPTSGLTRPHAVHEPAGAVLPEPASGEVKDARAAFDVRKQGSIELAHDELVGDGQALQAETAGHPKARERTAWNDRRDGVAIAGHACEVTPVHVPEGGIRGGPGRRRANGRQEGERRLVGIGEHQQAAGARLGSKSRLHKTPRELFLVPTPA